MRVIIVICYLLLIWSCRIESRIVPHTIEIFWLGDADSITPYNKGLGFFKYVKIDLTGDSLICHEKVNFQTNKYSTFIQSNQHFRSNPFVKGLLQSMPKYKEGIIKESTDFSADVYCGTEVYLTYRKGAEVKTLCFLQHRFDEGFDTFQDYCSKLSGSKENVVLKNFSIPSDDIVVEALKRLGFYEKMATPYIPLPCKPGIDMAKIFGTWRSAWNRYEKNKSYYTKYTLFHNGVYRWEKIKDGKTTAQATGKFQLNKKDSSFIMEVDKTAYKYSILTLTGNCFEYKMKGDLYKQRWDRL